MDSTGRYARCTREERAGTLTVNTDGTYSHLLEGECECGATHGYAPPGPNLSTPTIKHEIRSPDGTLLGVHARKGTGPRKRIWWEQLNGHAPADMLYRAETIAQAEGPVVLCEGERAADAVARLGIEAVGSVCGASATLSPAAAALLAGREVWLWPDADDQGKAHMDRNASALAAAGARVRFIEWADAPPKGDAADYIACGGTAGGLRAMVVEPANGKGARSAFVRLSDVEEREISWFWDGRIPWGSVTLVAGDGGVGKSTFVQELAGCMTRGDSPPGGGELDHSRSVVILSGEEDASAVVRPRMRLAGVILDRILVLGTDDAGFTLPSGMEELMDLCRTEDAGMVIVDTGPAFLDKDLRGNNEEEIRRMLRPLRGLAEELRLTVLVLAHLNKRDGGDSRHRVMGGAAWVNASRSVLFVGAPPGQDPRETGDRMVAVEKSNLGAYPPAIAFTLASAEEDQRYARVTWGEEAPGVRSSDLVAPQETADGRSAREDAMDFLLDELRDGPAPVSELKKAAKDEGHSWTTMKRAKATLGVLAEKSALAGGWRWMLPKKGPGSKGTVSPEVVPFGKFEEDHSRRGPTQSLYPSKGTIRRDTGPLRESDDDGLADEDDDIPNW